MKEKNILITIGIAIYVILTIVNKFIYYLPDALYISIATIGIIFILIGFIKDRKSKDHD